MSTLFVTGSGTGVGKTLVTQLIVTALRQRGRRVHALKPIVSGFDASAPEESDTAQLLDALGMTLDAPNLDAVSPWRFAEPLSPDMAARREGRTIPFDELVAFCARQAADTTTVIEGVGGVMVPLDESHTVIDWIAAVASPTVLVTGSYLGAISHTLTALETLSARRHRDSRDHRQRIRRAAGAAERDCRDDRTLRSRHDGYDAAALVEARASARSRSRTRSVAKKKGGAVGTAPSGRLCSVPYS